MGTPCRALSGIRFFLFLMRAAPAARIFFFLDRFLFPSSPSRCKLEKTYKGGVNMAKLAEEKLVFLSPSEIQPNPHQPRQTFDPSALEELAASIRCHGVLQPLSVRKAHDGW